MLRAHTKHENPSVACIGEHLENVYAIGPLRKAKEWESTAIREIRTQAEQLANLISTEINNASVSVTV